MTRRTATTTGKSFKSGASHYQRRPDVDGISGEYNLVACVCGIIVVGRPDKVAYRRVCVGWRYERGGHDEPEVRAHP